MNRKEKSSLLGETERCAYTHDYSVLHHFYYIQSSLIVNVEDEGYGSNDGMKTILQFIIVILIRLFRLETQA